ncbi:hypothetical protein FN846DRAFT_949776 [Sphaerosporella brunnea]|uniref:Uncharacterized protein n=1 Tax=Sphaerosporella brunnea TaxID=1250544 RepID=A0A5J5EWA5_9PEZI|nr:hypothetical protein FN846DRAFT_949776 [Sphaerosporella brunnea]
MEVLLSTRPDTPITQRIVSAAARNRSSGKEVMELLLSTNPEIPITECIVTAAGKNEGCGKEVMALFIRPRACGN